MAVVLAARELARRPVACVMVLLAVEPALELVELLTSGRVRIDFGVERLGDGLRRPPEALLLFFGLSVAELFFLAASRAVSVHASEPVAFAGVPGRRDARFMPARAANTCFWPVVLGAEEL